MIKLFKIEFQKLISLSAFRAIAIIHVALFIVVLIAISGFELNIPGLDFKQLFKFPEIWGLTTWVSSWFNLLLSFLIIIFIGNEYTFKTFRQNVIDGLSRTQLLLGKTYIILLFGLSAMVLVFLSSIIVGFFNTETISVSDIFGKAYLIFVYFIQSVAYMTLAMLVVILVKNVGLSILFFMLFFFPVEPILRAFLPDSISMYLPFKVISNLTPLPNVVDVNTQSNYQLNAVDTGNIQAATENTDLLFNTFVAIVYITVFWIASLLVLKKRDL